MFLLHKQVRTGEWLLLDNFSAFFKTTSEDNYNKLFATENVSETRLEMNRSDFLKIKDKGSSVLIA